MSRPIDPRLLEALPGVRRLLQVLVALQVGGVLLTVGQAVLLARVAVAVLAGSSRTGADLVLLGAVLLGRALLSGAQEWVVVRGASRTRADLRRVVLSALVRLGPSWVVSQPPGQLVTAGGPGLDAVDGYVMRALPAVTAACVVPPVALLAVLTQDGQSGLLLLATLPLVPVFMVLVGATTRARTQAQYVALARLAGHFLDLVQGLTTLKVYGQAHRQVTSVRRATEAYRVQALKTLQVALLSGLVLDLLATLSVAVVAVDVGLRLRSGTLALEPALVVLLLAPELFAPLRALGAQHHAAEQGRTACAAALDVLDACPPLLPVRGRTPVPSGPLVVTGVGLSYPGRALPALQGVDLVLHPRQVVVLQGPSGSGKSSVLAVLLHLVDPDHGEVCYGPDPLSELDPLLWRERLAWSPQRPRTTQTTVAQEVLLGAPQASADQVRQALVDCDALPADTPLGEDGRHVSAGQRRRVSLARALLRARVVRAGGAVPLVLLDEPSEDLDGRTEQVVARVIADMAGWATVLVATHSARLAALADVRVQMVDGRIAGCAPCAGPPVTSHADDAAAQPPPYRPPATHPQPDPPKHQGTGRSVMADLLADAGRNTRRRLFAAALLSGGTGLAGLGLLSTSLWLILRAAQHPEVQSLALAVVGVRAFALLRALLRYAERLVGHDGALRLLSDVRTKVFQALVPLAPSGLADLRRGDLLRRFVTDVDGAQDALVRVVVPVTGAAFTCCASVVLALLLESAAGLALAVGLVAALVGVPFAVRRLAAAGPERAAAAARQDTRVGVLLDGLEELTVYGAADRALHEVVGADGDLVQDARRPALAAAVGVALTGAAASLTLPLVLAGGVAAAAAGRLGLPGVGVLLACVLTGFDGLAPLPTALAAWPGLRSGLDRVRALTSQPSPMAEPGRPATSPEGRLGLALRDLTLVPAPGTGAVLVQAGLSIPAGRRVALLGPSGSGKSTVLTAALRLLPLTGGDISLVTAGASTSLRALAAPQVPPLVAGSLQGDHVFHASLADNLRVVRPSATGAELDAVAARVGLLGFVQSLPDGWTTSAGPDGGHLSGGQRQRLLLARALLAHPVVLVLDEPTAHLDDGTAQAVLADLLRATPGQTLLLSTHRRLPAGAVDASVHLLDGGLVPEADLLFADATR